MTDAEIEAKVAEWHDGGGYGQSLHELGMTWAEYRTWVMPPKEGPDDGHTFRFSNLSARLVQRHGSARTYGRRLLHRPECGRGAGLGLASGFA